MSVLSQLSNSIGKYRVFFHQPLQADRKFTMELFIPLNIKEAEHGAAGLEQWKSSPRTLCSFYKPAWGVTCLPGFHQALLWVPEENFLVCVIGRSLVPRLGSPCKAWKESCAHGISLLSPAWCWAAESSKPTQLHILSLGTQTPSKCWCWESSQSICSGHFLLFSISGRAACRSAPSPDRQQQLVSKTLLFRVIPHNSFWRRVGSSSWTPHPGHWKCPWQSWGHAKHQL